MQIYHICFIVKHVVDKLDTTYPGNAVSRCASSTTRHDCTNFPSTTSSDSTTDVPGSPVGCSLGTKSRNPTFLNSAIHSPSLSEQSIKSIDPSLFFLAKYILYTFIFRHRIQYVEHAVAVTQMHGIPGNHIIRINNFPLDLGDLIFKFRTTDSACQFS